jgi:hypothetical protein
MKRLFVIAMATALISALGCGPNEEKVPPKASAEADDKDVPEEKAQPDEKAGAEPEVSPEPPTKADPLPESWSALAEALAAEDRPALKEGVEPARAAGGTGEVELPLPGGASGSGETHTRHGWKMPDGHGSAIGVVRWTDASWKDIKVDVGVGICPHRGKALVSDVSSSGTAVAFHGADAPADDPNWFIHINADANQAAKAGEALGYVWAVFTY